MRSQNYCRRRHLESRERCKEKGKKIAKNKYPRAKEIHPVSPSAYHIMWGQKNLDLQINAFIHVCAEEKKGTSLESEATKCANNGLMRGHEVEAELHCTVLALSPALYLGLGGPAFTASPQKSNGHGKLSGQRNRLHGETRALRDPPRTSSVPLSDSVPWRGVRTPNPPHRGTAS